MIPMTVSFFSKQSKTKKPIQGNAIIYGIAIIFIYVVLGFLVTWIFWCRCLKCTLYKCVVQHHILYTCCIASSFWVLSIMLPNSWANKVDNQADRGGIIGILFMALALAIVSFRVPDQS
jgi:thiol:disulfide interchange protein DsbD